MKNGKPSRRRLVLLLLFSFLLTSLLFALAGFEPVWPENGKKTKNDSSLTVDYSHMEDGYILCKGTSGKSKLKLRIVVGEETYTYDINNNGEYEVFPLQQGSGKYKITLYKNTSGKKYATAGSVGLKVELTREDAAFLCPNQYVNYTEDSTAVQVSREICQGLEGDEAIYNAVCDYIQTNFTYDFIKALTVEAGALPDLEAPFTKHMGVCQDMSAAMVCMLRVQGIPARLMIGYADKNYHAWVSATVNGEERQFDPTLAVNGMSEPKEYTLERYY